jgi:hypothetical protein
MTALEYELIKTHAQAGYGILKEIEFPWPITQMVWFTSTTNGLMAPATRVD